MTFLNSLQVVSYALLRIAVAVIAIHFGYPKLLHGDPVAREFLMQHGIPGWLNFAAGVILCFGGLLVGIGLFTRAAALLLTLELAFVLWKINLLERLMVINDYQLPLILAAACFVLATVGPGKLSVDYLVLGSEGKTKRASKSASSSSASR